MKRVLKFLGKLLLGLIVFTVVVGALFMNLSPQFGGDPTDEEIVKYQELDYYEEDAFVNLIPTSMDMSFSSVIDLIEKQIEGTENASPDFEVPQMKVAPIFLEKERLVNKIIWFGHSAVLLQINGKNVLLDPMLGEVPAPHPMLGPSRYHDELPIEIEELPQIDFVLISHDHYDHLDYESIKLLKEKTKNFLVPFGVAAHLRSWEVEESKIHELAWWDEIELDELKFAFTPSRHFSGRGLERNNTLWGSWVVMADSSKVYFSGDGGYGPHFKEIGEKYGPFDFAMLECGQYNEKWASIHMMPEETAQAGLDVKAKVMMPIHWGAFTLALHSWIDPVVRVQAEAEVLNIPLVTPKIGEPMYLDSIVFSKEKWWIKPN